MRERGQQYLSEIGENLSVLSQSIQALTKYIRDLEDLVIEYREFVVTGPDPSAGRQNTQFELARKAAKLVGTPAIPAETEKMQDPNIQPITQTSKHETKEP